MWQKGKYKNLQIEKQQSDTLQSAVILLIDGTLGTKEFGTNKNINNVVRVCKRIF